MSLYEGILASTRCNEEDRRYFDTVRADAADIATSDRGMDRWVRIGSRACLWSAAVFAVLLVITALPLGPTPEGPFLAAERVVSEILAHAYRTPLGNALLALTLIELASGLALRAVRTARCDIVGCRIAILLYSNSCPIRTVKGMKLDVRRGGRAEDVLQWSPRKGGGT